MGLRSFNLQNPVGIEDDGARVFSMEGKPLGGLCIRFMVELPLELGIPPLERIGELQVGLDPCNSSDAGCLGGDKSP